MKTSIKYLQKYANKVRGKYYLDMADVSVSLTKPNRHIGGMAIGKYKILLPKWMLADKNQAKSTIRHELAHNIVNWLNLDKVISHGKEFHDILKQIAPRTWRNDLHWQATEAIIEARIKAGIKKHEYKPMKPHYFTCGNPSCPETHLYGWKRTPYHIKAGLFAPCKDCGCKSIIETKTNKIPMIFTSVH